MHISVHLYLFLLGSLRSAFMEIQQRWWTDRWVTATLLAWRTVVPFGVSNEHFDSIVWVREIDSPFTHWGSLWWGRGSRIKVRPIYSSSSSLADGLKFYALFGYDGIGERRREKEGKYGISYVWLL